MVYMQGVATCKSLFGKNPVKKIHCSRIRTGALQRSLPGISQDPDFCISLDCKISVTKIALIRAAFKDFMDIYGFCPCQRHLNR